MNTSGDTPARRRFLGRIVLVVQAIIAGTLGVIVRGLLVSPVLGRSRQTWLPAAALRTLPQGEPTPVTLRVTREDGYTQIIDRRTVFLVRNEGSDVIAFDSTCTHLGCRVSWNTEAQELRCPCHGGVFDRSGAVKAGPPPAALARVAVRIEGNQVLVQL